VPSGKLKCWFPQARCNYCIPWYSSKSFSSFGLSSLSSTTSTVFGAGLGGSPSIDAFASVAEERAGLAARELRVPWIISIFHKIDTQKRFGCEGYADRIEPDQTALLLLLIDSVERIEECLNAECRAPLAR